MPYVPFADRIAGLRPTAVNRVLQEVRMLQDEGQPLVSLMRDSPIRQRRRTSSRPRGRP